MFIKMLINLFRIIYAIFLFFMNFRLIKDRLCDLSMISAISWMKKANDEAAEAGKKQLCRRVVFSSFAGLLPSLLVALFLNLATSTTN